MPPVLSASVTGAPTSGWTNGFTLFSLETSRPLSTGNALGLELDSLASAIFSITPTAGDVFHFLPGSASQYPRATFTFPPAIASIVSGRTIDGVVFLMNGTTLAHVSNVARVSVQ